MTEPMNFQSIIMTLQDFWAKKGCLIWQPYYTQVGAGTFNPATYLRVLGPEPWNVGYVEPSIRPDDGRYGENPNRMQMHYQFQVILKPDPGNPQEIYLQSLEALGIDLRQHDIRFVEDNWESPALGAWGLGWEVWLDGQEITQFTYFQQAGGILLDPVSVEITYGLERIAIALQQVSSFRDIQWSTELTDGDVNLQAEQEQSKYYFEEANIERLRQMYDLFESEAKNCIAKGLVLPAHDYLLKCSHTFNVLDTRGAVGVTERQAMFGRMREVARGVAETYLDQRRRLEFPWLKRDIEFEREVGFAAVQKTLAYRDEGKGNAHAWMLLEIGTEELPAGDLSSALRQLQVRIPELLTDLRLPYRDARVLGTPRRLVVLVEDLASRQNDLEQVVKGPPENRAFGADGSPTQAAEGFARSKGLTIADLQIREIDGGRYVTALVREAGRPTLEVLAEALPGWIASLRFEKPMRWNHSNVVFSRPIRWLLALYGAEGESHVIPFEYAGLSAGDSSRGLRFRQPLSQQIHTPKEYFDYLDGQGIVLDPSERLKSVSVQVKQLAAEAGGMIQDDLELLNEVSNLVEAPTALRGSFDSAHLNLPIEVLISVMKKHQRYFPVHLPAADGKAGELLPFFIVVRNGDRDWLDLVADGNEHVVRARFADAHFFVQEDLKKPLEEYLPRLSTLTFQTRLGTMLDKVHRIQALVEDIAAQLELDETQLQTARRAAALCKADLGTKMVVEMTSLQGQMGRYYALKSGESEAVAEAVLDHYLPRYSGDQLAGSLPGLAVGLADRLDTLAGLFAANLAPTGNKDPFAQRRTALGLIQNLIAWDLDFDLQIGLKSAGEHQSIPVPPESQQIVLEFIIERLRNVLLEQGNRFDVVDAVLSAQGKLPARAARAVNDVGSVGKATRLGQDPSSVCPLCSDYTGPG